MCRLQQPNYLLLLILKSRTLTTITQRIERDVKKIRDYATVFRDSGSEVKFPGLSQKIREGWQVCHKQACMFAHMRLFFSYINSMIA